MQRCMKWPSSSILTYVRSLWVRTRLQIGYGWVITPLLNVELVYGLGENPILLGGSEERKVLILLSTCHFHTNFTSFTDVVEWYGTNYFSFLKKKGARKERSEKHENMFVLQKVSQVCKASFFEPYFKVGVRLILSCQLVQAGEKIFEQGKVLSNPPLELVHSSNGN